MLGIVVRVCQKELTPDKDLQSKLSRYMDFLPGFRAGKGRYKKKKCLLEIPQISSELYLCKQKIYLKKL